MSRRFVFLVAAGVLGVSASVAFAAPPGGLQPRDGINPIPPVNPPPASLCPQVLPHPVLDCRAIAVICAASPKSQYACQTVESVGPASASVKKLELQLPRRYTAVMLECRAKSTNSLACRVTSHTDGSATGIRVAVVGLPKKSFVSVQIACGASKHIFACKLQN
jgi:hypothetical protein